VFGVHYNQIVRLGWSSGPFDVDVLLANGEYGVSLFFTLSGLLLSLPFWRSPARGTPRPGCGRYLLRRGARILPAYWVCLTLLIVLDGLWWIPGAATAIALHYTFLFNFTEFTVFSLNPPF
jgi:peptidoglycan/LPS O-acetylase OafA/YrhL